MSDFKIVDLYFEYLLSKVTCSQKQLITVLWDAIVKSEENACALEYVLSQVCPLFDNKDRNYHKYLYFQAVFDTFKKAINLIQRKHYRQAEHVINFIKETFNITNNNTLSTDEKKTGLESAQQQCYENGHLNTRRGLIGWIWNTLVNLCKCAKRLIQTDAVAETNSQLKAAASRFQFTPETKTAEQLTRLTEAAEAAAHDVPIPYHF